jgi:hypothetical protein
LKTITKRNRKGKGREGKGMTMNTLEDALNKAIGKNPALLAQVAGRRVFDALAAGRITDKGTMDHIIARCGRLAPMVLATDHIRVARWLLT